MSVEDLPHLKPDLMTYIQSKGRDGKTYKRRSENLDWVRVLPLKGLRNEEMEFSIPMAQTSRGERLFIQYPGKESKESERRDWSNPRDFRPKHLKHRAESYGADLTFSQLWDPLVDNLRSLEHQYDRNEFAAVLGILFYRMAYMVDYTETTAEDLEVTVVKEGKMDGTKVISFGQFWRYDPPKEVVRVLGKAFPDWGYMTLEAYLHYNSLLAWNEDGKCLAKFPDWNLADARGRINTLLTHVRVIGFIAGKVELSPLLGDFTRRRGMSPAPLKEIQTICGQYLESASEPAQQTLPDA